VTLTVSVLHAVILGGRSPALTLIVHPSKATTLSLTLRNAKGETLATWHRRVKAGAHRLSFVLPPKARHAGKDTLRLSSTEGRTKTVAVTMSAPRRRHR